MKNLVLTFNNITKKVVYESIHQTAESAYEEYVRNIALVKKFIRKGEETTVVRMRDGHIMAYETIKG